MAAPMEKIDDLITWIENIKNLGKDGFSTLELTEDQISVLASAQEIISLVKLEFPGAFKRCGKCGKIFPAVSPYFTNHPTTKDRLQNHCKFCRNDYNKRRQKLQRIKKSLFGYSCQADLDEVNRIRALNGEPPLDQQPKKKRGRPKKQCNKNSYGEAAPGELYDRFGSAYRI